MAASLPRNSGPRNLQVALTAQGTPEKPVNKPVWSVNDESIGAVAAADDGMTATVTFRSVAGALIVTASADNVSATFEYDLQALPVDAAVITDITPAA